MAGRRLRKSDVRGSARDAVRARQLGQKLDLAQFKAANHMHVVHVVGERLELAGVKDGAIIFLQPHRSMAPSPGGEDEHSSDVAYRGEYPGRLHRTARDIEGRFLAREDRPYNKPVQSRSLSRRGRVRDSARLRHGMAT